MPVFCLCAAAFCALALLVGNADAQGQPVEARRTSTFGSDDLMLPIFAPGSESDADLGVQMILEPEAEYEPVTVAAYAGYEFSDNANLSEFDPHDDSYFNSSIVISYLPILVGNLFGEATVNYEWFRYNSDSDLDFDVFDAGAGLFYVIRKLGDTAIYTRYNYIEYWDSHDLIDDLYSSHSIQTGFHKEWIPARNQFIYATGLADLSFDATPSFAKRDEYSVVLGYRWVPIRKLKADIFYRQIYLNFDEDDRSDWNSTTGGALTWNFTPNLYLSGLISYTGNDSSAAVIGDYKAWITGVRLGGYWQF